MDLDKQIELQEKVLISPKKYRYLKQFKSHSEIEKKQIEDFEKSNAEALQSQSKYWEQVFAEKPKIDFLPTFDQIRNAFLNKYQEVSGRQFVSNTESESNLEILCAYFSKDDRFFKSQNLSNISQPNFEKGLLIIGNYGNGKTSYIETFHHLFRNTPLAFAFRSTNHIVEEFEVIKEKIDFELFWRNQTTKPRCFDDCKTERIASNFGKVNVMKDILEKRYSNKIKTFITCNYNENFPGSIEKGVEEFGLKYGARVYDRLFEMFNVIEFKGKSFRK